MKEAAQAPHVAGEAVWLPLEHFRRDVAWCADYRARSVCWRGELDGATEVGDAHLCLVAEV